jgi:chromosome segregation ATPase
MNTDVEAAEKIRQLTSTNAMFANFMADSSFDSAEETLRFVQWFEEIGRVPSGWDVTRYCRAQMAIAYVEQAAQLAEATAKLERLAEIDRHAQADAADLEKMRDGTKLTRSGLVQIISYQQQELAEATAKLAAAEAKIDDYKSALLDAQEKHIESVGKNAELREQLAAFNDPTLVDEAWLIASGQWWNDGYGCYRPRAKMVTDVMWYIVPKEIYILGKKIGPIARGQLLHLLTALGATR